MPVTGRLRIRAFGEMLVRAWQAVRLLMPSAVKPVLATVAPRDQTAAKALTPQLLG